MIYAYIRFTVPDPQLLPEAHSRQETSTSPPQGMFYECMQVRVYVLAYVSVCMFVYTHM